MTADLTPSDASTSRAHRRSPIRFAAVVAVFGLGMAAASCSSGPTSTPPTSTPSTSAPSTSAAGSARIVISNFMFDPAKLTVRPGATVVVVNHDQVAHTLTATSGGFNTRDIDPGGTATFTAPKTSGIYTYICSIHQYMTGSVVVS